MNVLKRTGRAELAAILIVFALVFLILLLLTAFMFRQWSTVAEHSNDDAQQTDTTSPTVPPDENSENLSPPQQDMESALEPLPQQLPQPEPTPESCGGKGTIQQENSTQSVPNGAGSSGELTAGSSPTDTTQPSSSAGSHGGQSDQQTAQTEAGESLDISLDEVLGPQFSAQNQEQTVVTFSPPKAHGQNNQHQTPEEAVAFATEKLNEAKKAKARGAYGSAYVAAAEGYTALERFATTNANARALQRQLLNLLRECESELPDYTEPTFFDTFETLITR